MAVTPARPGETVVGLIANARSGHDIRRLVARASVFPNSEKVAMIQRLLGALGAVGVDRVVSMVDGGGVAAGVARAVEVHHPDRDPVWPAVEFLDLPLTNTAADSVAAARALVGLGAAVLVVLGGDGTDRVVAGACGAVPMAALSTGTNNAFAQLGEATVVGLAAGLAATGRLGRAEACRRNKVLEVRHGDRVEPALVDVAVTAAPGVGARAVWEPSAIRELFVTFADPGAVGLSSVAGLTRPVGRSEPVGLHLLLGRPAAQTVLAPIAPGLVAPVGVRSVEVLAPGDARPVGPAEGVVAIDGERELEYRGAAPTVTLSLDGPWSIDVPAAMAAAARRGLLTRPAPHP